MDVRLFCSIKQKQVNIQKNQGKGANLSKDTMKVQRYFAFRNDYLKLKFKHIITYFALNQN